MGAGIVPGVGVAIANQQWRSAIKNVPANHGKCQCCGSHEYAVTARGDVCAYCRVPPAAEKATQLRRPMSKAYDDAFWARLYKDTGALDIGP